MHYIIVGIVCGETLFWCLVATLSMKSYLNLRESLLLPLGMTTVPMHVTCEAGELHQGRGHSFITLLQVLELMTCFITEWFKHQVLFVILNLDFQRLCKIIAFNILLVKSLFSWSTPLLCFQLWSLCGDPGNNGWRLY